MATTMIDTGTTSTQLLDTMLAATLPVSWKAELYGGLGDEWHEDADCSWLQPEPED